MTNMLITLSLVLTSSLGADALSDLKNQAAALDATLVTQLEETAPRATRAGWLRYNDALLLEPEAATWALHELQSDTHDARHRRALLPG